MYKKTKLALPMLALLAAALALAACGGSAPAPASQPAATKATQAATEQSTQAQATGGEMSKTFQTDPALAADPDSQKVASYLYEGLVRLDGDQVKPVLTRSWIVSEDGLTYTFDLWSNAIFSDGTPVNAAVVVANFNRWFDPASPDRGSGDYKAFADAFGGFKGETDASGKPKPEIDGVDNSDNITVIVHLNRPDPDFLKKLAGVPFSIVLKQGDKLLGSGPYVLGTKTDTSLTLNPNTKYWAGAPGEALVFTLK